MSSTLTDEVRIDISKAFRDDIPPTVSCDGVTFQVQHGIRCTGYLPEIGAFVLNELKLNNVVYDRGSVFNPAEERGSYIDWRVSYAPPNGAYGAKFRWHKLSSFKALIRKRLSSEKLKALLLTDVHPVVRSLIVEILKTKRD